MADKPDKKPAEPAAGGGDDHGKKAKGGGLLAKTPVLMGAVMLVEAVVLIAGFKILAGGPKHADAAADAGAVDPHDPHAATQPAAKDKKNTVELPVLDIRAINKVSGRTLLFDVSIVASIKADQQEQAKKTLADRKGLITDRVRTIIAQSDPEKLSGGLEPGLETLRRQVKYQLDEIIGDKVVDDVLVPRCIPFRADF